jgi:biotin synthase-like enzyme
LEEIVSKELEEKAREFLLKKPAGRLGRDAAPKVFESYVRDFADFAQQHTAEVERKLFEAEQVIKMVWNRGHNNDCLYCGLKDREVKAYIDKYLPEFSAALSKIAEPDSAVTRTNASGEGE